MATFNSLGSNYNLDYVLKSLFSNSKGANQKLKNFLSEKYEGTAILTYKGREALTLALKISDLPKGSAVAINGFTCFFVYKAVQQARLTPICLDLEKDSDLNFTPETFEKAIKENKNIKAVIIQNTFGYPVDIEKINKICREKDIVLIEDLAHCIGARYANGKEAGTVGDFAALSFSQDKVIDAVSGGALVIRNKKFSNLTIQQFNNVNNFQKLKDHLYSHFTFKIRKLYDVGLGKPLHFLLKKLNLLSQPMQEGLYDFYSLPDWYCNIALREFDKLNEQLNHRRKVAKIYAENLDEKILNKSILKNIDYSSNLRFPIFVKNRKSLIKYLKDNRIFVSDIWYDDVAKECPNAVEISQIILNLPTHINVQEKDALRISETVNLWLQKQ